MASPIRAADDNYAIAFGTESGEWDIVEYFETADDAAANAYAEAHYPDDEWFVLDAKSRRNINA